MAGRYPYDNTGQVPGIYAPPASPMFVYAVYEAAAYVNEGGATEPNLVSMHLAEESAIAHAQGLAQALAEKEGLSVIPGEAPLCWVVPGGLWARGIWYVHKYEVRP